MTLFYRLLGFSSMFLSVFDVLASPRQDYLAGLQMLHKKALGCCYFPVAAPHPSRSQFMSFFSCRAAYDTVRSVDLWSFDVCSP